MICTLHLRGVLWFWFADGVVSVTLRDLLTLYQMNLKGKRAVWISTFRRPSLLIKLFSFSWTSITINQLRRCLASGSFRIQGRLDSGLWGPSRADYGGLCASPRTFGDRVQLDRQVHIEDRRGRVVTMRKWSLYHLRSQWSDRWISYKLTRKISRHRKPTASGWSELPRTTSLTIAYANGKYLRNFWDKRLARFTYSVLQNTGTLWT